MLGVDHPAEQFQGTVIAIIHRLDDNEDKWVVAPEGVAFTKEEIMSQVDFQEQYFQTEIEMRRKKRPASQREAGQNSFSREEAYFATTFFRWTNRGRPFSFLIWISP